MRVLSAEAEPATGCDPESEVLSELLAGLPQEVRLPVAMVHEIGLDPRESAEVLGLEPAVFNQVVDCGLRALCRRLAQRGLERLPHQVGEALGKIPLPRPPEGMMERLREIVRENLDSPGDGCPRSREAEISGEG